jgi:hypothetical protein
MPPLQRLRRAVIRGDATSVIAVLSSAACRPLDVSRYAFFIAGGLLFHICREERVIVCTSTPLTRAFLP